MMRSPQGLEINNLAVGGLFNLVMNLFLQVNCLVEY